MILSVYLQKTELCKVHCSCLAAPPAPAPASSAVTRSGVLQGRDPPWHRAEGQPAAPGWTHSAETKQRGFASLRFSPKDTPLARLPPCGSRLCVSPRPQLHLSPAALALCRDRYRVCRHPEPRRAPSARTALRTPVPPESQRAPIPFHRAHTNKGRSSYFR